MSKGTKWTKERLDRFGVMWERGDSVAAMAEHFGISDEAIRDARMRYGFKRRPWGGKAFHRGPRPCSQVPASKPARLAVLPCPAEPGWPTREQLMGRR